MESSPEVAGRCATSERGTTMFGRFNIDYYLEKMRAAKQISDLDDIMNELTAALGFDQFALGHHVDLLRPPSQAARLTNYDPVWIEQALEKRFFTDDPVHAASARLVRPFHWTEIFDHLVMSDRRLEILERGAKIGLVEGYTIPVHQPGEYNGTCSFSARSFEHLHGHVFAVAHYAATFAFECARRLMRLADGKEPERVPQLTGRQVESVILVGRGKSDAEIAAVMNITQSTAHDHVEAGRRAYGNAQRPRLVALALYDGIITFPDLLDP